MKICLSDSKKYLLHYLFFCIVFTSVLLLLTWITAYLTKNQEKATTDMLPTDHNTAPIVVIDAGHGGEDGGTIGTNGIYEKDLNLQIAKLLCDMLDSCGVQTVMTRNEDILLYDRNSDYQGQKKVQDLATRRKIAEQYENAIFISIHMNAFPQEQYSGLQVYYSPNTPESSQLAQMIQDITKDLLLPENQRKIKPSGGNIYLLDRLYCPAILIECGFLSNPAECARLSTEEYQQQMALAICLAIFDYFSSSVKNPASGT